MREDEVQIEPRPITVRGQTGMHPKDLNGCRSNTDIEAVWRLILREKLGEEAAKRLKILQVQRDLSSDKFICLWEMEVYPTAEGLLFGAI